MTIRLRLAAIMTLCVLAAGCAGPAAEPVPAPVAEPAPLSPFVQAERMGRGINLGNALEAPNEGVWGVVLKEEYFQMIKEKGFATVRIPIRWSAHAAKEAPYTIDETFFKRVDWAVDTAFKHQLNVVIDVHHYDEIFQDPAGHKERWLALWRQIAARYKDKPDGLFLEPLNEPHDKLTAEIWNSMLAEAVAEIRKIDKRHTLIYGLAEWGGLGSLDKLRLPPGESNAIVTFHYYEPILFTHQDASWNGPDYATRGITWPGPPAKPVEPSERVTAGWVKQWIKAYNEQPAATNPASEAAIVAAFDRASKWAGEKKVPLFLGEFGALETVDMESRVRWTTVVRREAERHAIPWAYWEFCSTFGIYQPLKQEWREPLLRALVPAK